MPPFADKTTSPKEAPAKIWNALIAPGRRRQILFTRALLAAARQIGETVEAATIARLHPSLPAIHLASPPSEQGTSRHTGTPAEAGPERHQLMILSTTDERRGMGGEW